MSGISLLSIGLVIVIIFALIFFGFISKRSEHDNAKIDRLIELNELTERKKIEKFMEDNDFYQVYQPFVDGKTEKIVGCEALSRLDGEDESDTMPENFLKKIREENLVDKFDMFVLKKCCEWIKSGGESAIEVTCNFSRSTLGADKAAERIKETADEVGISHNLIGIEITEDEIADCDEKMRENIAELKSAGFKIYLDDFGKAYTSIGDLAAFCPDVVKLDKDILYAADDEQGRQVFESVIKLAKEVGAKVLCEGVESREQAELAKKLGCDILQGYYYYKPIKAQTPSALQ